MAKLEPAARHRNSDYAVALPGVGSEGLGWKIADGVIIYKEQMSDSFLQVLSVICPRERNNAYPAFELTHTDVADLCLV